MAPMHAAAAIATVLCGCGNSAPADAPADGGSEPSEFACYLTMSIAGSKEQQIEASFPEGCGALGGMTGPYLDFPVPDPVHEVAISVTGGFGKVGGPFQATVLLWPVDATRVWETPAGGCTVDLVRSDLLEDPPDVGPIYAIAGTGSCVAPAAPTPSTGAEHAKIVGTLDFGGPAIWQFP